MPKTHGMTYGKDGKRTKLNRLWLNIRNRCNNPRGQDYKYYGGRGIRVCKRWDDFATFVKDVGQPPGPNWTLDRIDNNKGYTPCNVRWATRKTQGQNRPYCRLDQKKADEIRAKYKAGKVQTELAIEYGCTQTAISHVIRKRTWK